MPTTEKLKQEIADAEKKLAQERSRLQRLENRKSYYEKGDRKKRAHRLITCLLYTSRPRRHLARKR